MSVLSSSKCAAEHSNTIVGAGALSRQQMNLFSEVVNDVARLPPDAPVN